MSCSRPLGNPLLLVALLAATVLLAYTIVRLSLLLALVSP